MRIARVHWLSDEFVKLFAGDDDGKIALFKDAHLLFSQFAEKWENKSFLLRLFLVDARRLRTEIN